MFHDGPLIRDEEDYDILAAPCLEFLRCVKEQGKARKELVRWVLSWMPDVSFRPKSEHYAEEKSVLTILVFTPRFRPFGKRVKTNMKTLCPLG